MILSIAKISALFIFNDLPLAVNDSTYSDTIVIEATAKRAGGSGIENLPIYFEILEPELETITILNTINNFLCSNDSSQIEVEFDNLDPSSTYTYQIRDMSLNLPLGVPVGSNTIVGDTSTHYLLAGDYSIRLYQNNDWCALSVDTFTIEEYQLEIVDVYAHPDICGDTDGWIIVQIDPNISK